MPTPSPIDLATLQAVKDWANITSSAGDSSIQRCLSAWSVNFLRMTGRGPRDNQIPTMSPFNQPVSYTEIYNGNGNNRLFLRNWPINSVSSLNIFGSAIPAQSVPGSGATGYAVDDQGRSIVIVNSAIGSSGFTLYAGGPGFPRLSGGGGFPNGVQNVAVDYIAGFTLQTVAGALYTITQAWAPSTAYATGTVVSDGTYLQQAISSGTSGTTAPPWCVQGGCSTQDGPQPGLVWRNTGVQAAPNVVQLASDTAILSDGGVKYFSSGNPFMQVFVSPLGGQYFLTALGTYLFNAADAGQQVLIAYTAAGTPADIVQATCEAVSLNYKRQAWEGISSMSMKDVGQTTYTQFAMSKSVRDVVRNYTRSSWAS
jgi:hypothetical protein